MSIGPAPNLSGGISTNAACNNGGNGGGGGLAPNISPPYAQIASIACVLNCNCNFSSGGGGSGGGSCGSGSGQTTVFNAPQGATPQAAGSGRLICYGDSVATECGCLPLSDFSGDWRNFREIVQCLQNSPDPCSCFGNGLGDGDGTWLTFANAPTNVSTAYTPQLGTRGPGGPGTDSLGAPTIGALTPPPVPGSGDGFKIEIQESIPFSGNIESYPIYCQETGVTLSSACTFVTFFSGATSITIHLILGTHQGENCNDSSIHNYNAANQSGTTGPLPPGLQVPATRV